MMMPFDTEPDSLDFSEPQESENEPMRLSEAEAKKLKQRLKISERFKEREFKTHYEDSLRLMRGLHWPDTSTTPRDESRVIVNMIYPIVSTKVATIGFRYPEFNLTPMNAQSAGKAKLATAAMRYEWKTSGTQREMVRALHDKEVFKFGIVMTGWEFRTTTGINRRDGREEVAGENPEDGIDFEGMAKSISETGKLPDVTTPEDTICDRFYCKRISPWNFLIDPEGDWVLDNHEFCGYIEMVPLTDLKNDPRLKNTRDLQGTSRGVKSFLPDELALKDEKDQPTDIKRVKVYHYFEKRRQLYIMFCDEHEKPLLVEKWAWEHGRYPFRVIHAFGDEDRWYDQTPVEMIRSQQEELNITRTMLRNHIRRGARKYSVARGMLDRIAKLQLKSGTDGAVIEHNGGPDARVIMPIDHAPLVPEVYKTDEWVVRDMRFITGLDEYDTNTVGKTRRTAQEVAQIRQAGGSRAQSDAQQFEQFCAEVGEDLLDLLMQFSDKVRSIPIYGPYDNVQDWANFTADDIKGDYLVDVYIGSTSPKSSVDQQQQYAWLLQTLGQFAQMPDPQTGQPMVNVKALIKGILSSFPDIRNIDEILAPEPQPPPTAPPQLGAPPPGMPLPMDVGQMMQPQGL